jgi:VanZ family protein
MGDHDSAQSVSVNNGLKRFIMYHLPALLYAALIFYVSGLRSISPPPFGFSWDDKIYHFGEYALLSFFIFIALKYYRQESIRKYIHLVAIVIACIFAASDEIHQFFVPGRDSQLGDLLADSLGAILTQVAIWFYLKRKPQKSID